MSKATLSTCRRALKNPNGRRLVASAVCVLVLTSATLAWACPTSYAEVVAQVFKNESPGRVAMDRKIAAAQRHASDLENDAERLQHTPNHEPDTRVEPAEMYLNVPEMKVETQRVSLRVPTVAVTRQQVAFQMPVTRLEQVGTGPGHPTSECGWEMKELPFGAKTEVWGCHTTGWEQGPPIMAPRVYQQDASLDIPMIDITYIEQVLEVPRVTLTNPTHRIVSDLPKISDKSNVEEKKRTANDAQRASRSLPQAVAAIKAEEARRIGERLKVATEDFYACQKARLEQAQSEARGRLEDAKTLLDEAKHRINELPPENRSALADRVAAAERSLDEVAAQLGKFDAQLEVLDRNQSQRLGEIEKNYNQAFKNGGL